MNQISIEDFQKIELRVGQVLAAEPVAKSDKLLKIQLDFGDHQQQIISGIAKAYPDPQVLVGQQLVVIINLEPKEMMGLTSEGMVLVADASDGPAVLLPSRPVEPGSRIK